MFDWQTLRKEIYQKMLAAAADRNLAAVAAYKDKCANWIEVNVRNREMGLAITPVPTVPKKEVIQDTGSEFVTVYEEFTDLQPPVLPAPVVGVKSEFKAGNPNAEVLFALGVIKQDLDKILKFLGI